jgi:hydroxyacylglutathione hydrolase
VRVEHVVSVWPEPFLAAGGALEVHPLPAGRDNLVWLVVCTATREAAVVDGPDAAAAVDRCAQIGARLTTVLNTHTHGDHVGVNRDLARLGRLDGLQVVGPARDAANVPGLTRGVDEGDAVRIGDVVGRVLLTEGHLDGHVSYVFGDLLFCGDTLFSGGCGYLFSGPPSKMFHSLMRLAQLDGATWVCCAHEYTEDNLAFAWSVEPDNEALGRRIAAVAAARAEGRTVVPSRLEEERATNPFLRPGSPSVRAAAEAFAGRPLTSFEEVFAATRALKDTRRYKA